MKARARLAAGAAHHFETKVARSSLMTSATSGVPTVATKVGVRDIACSVAVAEFPMPTCAHPERLRPLLMTARCVAGALPASSARKVRGAVRMWHEALRWFGLEPQHVTESVVIAFLIMRCCPPVGMELPAFAQRPVLPTTAAADVDVLRRAAREGVEDMGRFLSALCHDRVLRMQRSIGGRVSRLKSNKRPFLFSQLVDCTRPALAKGATAEQVREAFALTLGFFFGMRSGELLQLKGADVNESSDDSMILVTFRHVKTRQSLFTTHEPYVVAARSPLLMQMFRRFDEVIGFRDDYPVFHQWRATRAERMQPSFQWTGANVLPLSRDWLARAVRRWAPGCSPHSLRVGCATEAWAAGVPLERIQALGRWASAAALLYIIGSLDQTASASSRLGHGGLSFTADGLRSQIGTSPDVRAAWWPTETDSAAAWRAAAALRTEDEYSEASDDDSMDDD